MPERQTRRDSTRTGRVPFVWVEDDDTKHRYDVPENAIRPGMTPVEGYDLNYTGRARATKYYVDKAGESAPSRVEVPSGDEAAAAAIAAKAKKAVS